MSPKINTVFCYYQGSSHGVYSPSGLLYSLRPLPMSLTSKSSPETARTPCRLLQSVRQLLHSSKPLLKILQCFAAASLKNSVIKFYYYVQSHGLPVEELTTNLQGTPSSALLACIKAYKATKP